MMTTSVWNVPTEFIFFSPEKKQRSGNACYLVVFVLVFNGFGGGQILPFAPADYLSAGKSVDGLPPYLFTKAA